MQTLLPRDVVRAAEEETGLADAGGDHLEALAVLLESYARDAGLTEAGWAKITRRLTDALAARLRTEAAWTARPVPDGPLSPRPVFVTGLPRSGTTALHRLLTADPRHQGLELWLAATPQPRPPRSAWADNPDHRRVKDDLDRRVAANPGLNGMHFMAPDVVEECWWLDRQTFRSWSFPATAHLPTYVDWLAQQDLTAGYEHHRRALQLIGSTEPDRRWVLKNPSHLFALDALLAAHPDALVVQIHRDPLAAIASVSSLTASSARGTSDTFTPEAIGRWCLDLWAEAADRFDLARAGHPATGFVDVDYTELVTDPVTVVARVYDALGVVPDEAAVAAVTARGPGEPTGCGAPGPPLRAGRLRPVRGGRGRPFRGPERLGPLSGTGHIRRSGRSYVPRHEPARHPPVPLGPGPRHRFRPAPRPDRLRRG